MDEDLAEEGICSECGDEFDEDLDDLKILRGREEIPKMILKGDRK